MTSKDILTSGVYKDALAEIERLRDYYRVDILPPHVVRRTTQILTAASQEDLLKRCAKATDVMFMHCLAGMSKGLYHPKDQAYYESQAARVEDLAQALEASGNLDAADSARAKAARLRDGATEKTANPEAQLSFMYLE